MPNDAIDWSRFFERYRAMAVRFASGLTADEALAEDLFQEAARGIYERATSGAIEFESTTHARNYLFRALRNLAAKSRRRGAPVSLDAAEHVAGTDPEPFDILARSEGPTRGAIVAAAVRRLDPADRELLRRRFTEGLTLRRISEITGDPISTLHSRIELLLKKIRRMVGNQDDTG